MMARLGLTCVLATGLTTTVGRTAAAQPAPPPASASAPQPISLAFIQGAVPAAPRHRAAAARRQAASLGVAAAGAWGATSFGVSTSWKTARLGLAMSVPLPLLGAARSRDASIAVAHAERAVAEAELGRTDLELVHDATRAWLELARAAGHRDAAHAATARELALLTATKERASAGDAARSDVVQATASERRAVARESADASSVVVASAELAAVLGWPADRELAFDGALAMPPEVQPLAVWRQRAAEQPALRVATAERAVADRQVEVARSARWPVLSLDADAAIDDPTLPGTDFHAGFSISVPLFGRTAAGIAAATARRDAVQGEREAIITALDAQVVAAYRRLEAARARVNAMEQDVLPAAREASNVARESYQEGVGGLASVLEGERLLAESELEAWDARVDAAQGYADLVWAAGGTP